VSSRAFHALWSEENSRYEFVNEIAVRGRLLHFQTERDDVLAERESFPRIACREPWNGTASQHDSTFNESKEA
jgi:hypothetical protein